MADLICAPQKKRRKTVSKWGTIVKVGGAAVSIASNFGGLPIVISSPNPLIGWTGDRLLQAFVII